MSTLSTTGSWTIACFVVLLSTGIVAEELLVDMEHVRGVQLLDSGGAQHATMLGDVRLSPDARSGNAALDFGGSGRKGVANFGPTFASDRAGTLEFWCKPRSLSGIMVGKYGAINIEYERGRNRISFGLKLKEKGWTHCKGPEQPSSLKQWVYVKASWGPAGMVLSIDGKPVAHAPLPAAFDWFIPDRNFLLGSYDWPGSYDVWFFDGLVDDLRYKPVQENVVLPPSPVVAEQAEFALLLRESPKPNYGVAVPAAVRGRVVLNTNSTGAVDKSATGVAGVSVSDGYSVVKTDADGRYLLHPSASAVFVFITRPSGHDVIGSWYQPVTETVDFALRRAGESEETFTFVQVTDTHVSTDERSLLGLRRFVKEVNALDPSPRFVFNSGDLVNLDKQLKAPPARGRLYFGNYAGTMNHLTMPYYNVAGDHTDSGYLLDAFPRGDHRAGKAMYWETFGPNLFSFEYGKLHFVSVDVVYHMEKTSHTMVPEHLAWFEQDIRNRAPRSVVLTASENPLDVSIAGFTQLAADHDIRLQLVGDTHVLSYQEKPVPSRSHGALAGTWWNGPCADLTPQGYMIYEVQGTRTDCFYKGLGERVAITSPAYGSLVKGEATFTAHLVQPTPGESLQISVGGAPWQPMDEAGRPFYRVVFEKQVDTTLAADGLVDIRVRLMPGGETRSWPFVVNNGTDDTRYDEDGSLEFSVGTVTWATLRPKAQVEVMVNGTRVGIMKAGHSGTCAFPVPAHVMRKTNSLTFVFSSPDDAISVTSPQLHVAGKTISDPRASAIQKVREGHWSQNVADRAGFVIGHDLPETSFATRQNAFHFVLPEPAR